MVSLCFQIMVDVCLPDDNNQSDLAGKFRHLLLEVAIVTAVHPVATRWQTSDQL